MSGRKSTGFVVFLHFRPISIAFVVVQCGGFWCETGAVLRSRERSAQWQPLNLLTTNLGVGRSNRSGRAIYLINMSSISTLAENGPRLKISFSLGFSLGKFLSRREARLHTPKPWGTTCPRLLPTISSFTVFVFARLKLRRHG